MIRLQTECIPDQEPPPGHDPKAGWSISPNHSPSKRTVPYPTRPTVDSQPNTPTHLEASLLRDIDRIRGKLTRMLDLGTRALDDALSAAESGNRSLAYQVILRDQLVDELEKEVDRLCLEFLIRQQPVAGHLRFVYAAIKINQELERVGDCAESIARQALKLIKHAHLGTRHRIREIASLAVPMLRDSIEAFLRQDVVLAERTILLENTVDTLRNEITRDLIAMRESGQIPDEALAPLSTITRRFERVSDQAKNICEEVIYFCTGHSVKHLGADHFRVLFLDQDNAGLSQLAEALANALDQEKFLFASAGIVARPVWTDLAAFMVARNLQAEHQRPKSLEQIPHLEHYQVAVIFDPKLRAAIKSSTTKSIILDWSSVAVDSAREDGGIDYEKAAQALDLQIRDLVHAILGNHESSSI